MVTSLKNRAGNNALHRSGIVVIEMPEPGTTTIQVSIPAFFRTIHSGGTMKTLIPVTMFLLICCIPASSQIIPIKTYPILAGGEFLPLPSENAAMGGISIPLADQFRDPFVNPAALAGNGESFVTSSLSQTKWRIVQTESQNSSTTTQMTEKGRNDGNVSLPVAVVLRYDNVAVGAIGSYQHLVSSQYENTVTVNSSEQTNTSSSFSETANRGTTTPIIWPVHSVYPNLVLPLVAVFQ
jgi:hypothetical protein